MITRNIAAEIKAALSCADFVGRYAKLRHVGGRWLANCPFSDHADKTPSFTVDSKWYKCFGCGRGGDVINFAQEYFGISFVESVRLLAQELNIPLKEQHSTVGLDVYVVLETAALMYQEALETSQAALQYLRSRGIDHKQFRLGWAGSGILPNAPLELLTRAGLVHAGRPFFRNRIIFPIIHAGRVSGFGARTITDEKPKYLNSPETEVFQKSKQLYSVPLATRVASPGVFLVEGYTDVLALARIGLRGFAPMGTALTTDHLRVLWRDHQCIYVAFDGDVAGRRAAERAVRLALPDLSAKRTIKIMQFKTDEDPGSIVEHGGAQGWRARQDQAVDVVEIFWAQLDTGTPEDRAREMQRVREQVEQIKDRELRVSYSQALRLRRPQAWVPPVRALPPRQVVHCIYGLLWRYPELCLQAQEQIAEIVEHPALRESALCIAEGGSSSPEWEQASAWAEAFENPAEVLRELFVVYRAQRRRTLAAQARAEYLADPSPERWRRFLEHIGDGNTTPPALE